MDSCKSCETLKEQLVIANHEKTVLLDRLLKISEPEIVPVAPTFTAPRPKQRTWEQQRKTLEEQDAVAARTLKDIKDLETELELKPAEDKSA